VNDAIDNPGSSLLSQLFFASQCLHNIFVYTAGAPKPG
jgi:hypothetical protein